MNRTQTCVCTAQKLRYDPLPCARCSVGRHVVELIALVGVSVKVRAHAPKCELSVLFLCWRQVEMHFDRDKGSVVMMTEE